MTNVLPAIYENGVLRPLTPLYLPEKRQVQLILLPLPEDTQLAKTRNSGWQEFFASTARPTEDFMQERVDLTPQVRERFE